MLRPHVQSGFPPNRSFNVERKDVESRALFLRGPKETRTPFVLSKDWRAIVETRKEVSRKPGRLPAHGLSLSLSLLEAAVIRVNGRGRRKPATTTDLRLKHRIPLPRSRGRNRGLINRVLDEILAKSMGHARILRS